MSYLQVRDFPEELHEQLRELAKKEHRSVSQQIIIAIQEHVAQASGRARDIQVFGAGFSRSRRDDIDYLERRKKVFERIRNTPKPEFDLSADDIVATIHEGRAERDARIGL